MYYDVYKIKLDSNSFMNTHTHAAIYIEKNNSITTTTVNQEPNKKYPITNIFINAFKGLEEVVATN